MAIGTYPEDMSPKDVVKDVVSRIEKALPTTETIRQSQERAEGEYIASGLRIAMQSDTDPGEYMSQASGWLKRNTEPEPAYFVPPQEVEGG